MGNVYLAVRTADFKQRVAVKVLKRGMDTDEILRRFHTEIQVLAALSIHPNIAGLIDAGTTADGLPYFVMEYVEGETIDHYCDKRRLKIPERLHLFRSVCAAVQFAHQHAIIHRDLKMSNILVTSDGVPKLIDFGIAKLTAPELADHTVLPTKVSERFLTPEYASPEQIRGDSITTVSDVYSLGVVLYELLTGHRPFRFDTRSMEKIERILDENDPAKPSSAVLRSASIPKSDSETSASDYERVSKSRESIPGRLIRTLRGDLDNICMKALRKEPQRRYTSVEHLLADIDRFQNGRPVEARPPGRFETIWRWCKSHPIPVCLIVAVAIGLTFGIYHLSTLSEYLVQMSALESAKQQANVLIEAQDFYSEIVIKDLDKPVAPLDHPFAQQHGKIPVPATFTIELAKRLSAKKSTGMMANLYSDRPFPSRMNDAANKRNAKRKPLDAFQTAALQSLRQDPDEPFSRIEEYQGRPALRFAVARVIKEDCLRCHNRELKEFADAPAPSDDKKWRVGDVRGVLEIIRPLDKDYKRIQRGLQNTFFIVFGLSAGLILLSLTILAIGKRRRNSTGAV